jgi:outer membrane receptor protein involved in Fe transport
MRPSMRAWAIAALFLLPASGVLGQATGGTVRGRVVAEGGSPLSGAAIAGRNLRTGVTRATTSDASGDYRMAELPVGDWEFTVTRSGFATEVRTGVTLFVGQQATLDFTLKVSPVAETVTVTGDVPIVQTTKSSIGATITTQQIDELPLAERSFTNLAFLAPGITQSTTEATDISGAGSSGSSNTFLIDGFSNDQDALGDDRGDYSPDAIGQYEVQSSSYSAEYGQASGAIINVLTRSGGNDLHFRVASYYRADGLAATNPFAQTDPETGEKEKTPFDQWIVSTFLGGPLQKDKLFFFASYEQTWRDETAVVGVDPDLLSSLGLSTETAAPRDLREPRVVAKLDYHLTSSQTLTGRFRLDNPTTTNLLVGDIVAGTAVATVEVGATLEEKNTDYAVSHSWILSPSAFNEARFQYARQSNDITEVNCPGCPFEIRPTVASGKAPNFPQTFTENRYQFLDSAGFTLLGKGGDHYLKTGVDYSNIKIDAFLPQNFDGVFQFTTDAPFNPADADTYPLIYQVGSGNPNIDISNNIVAVYLQDQWTVLPNLTLNLGVRWDYEDQVYVEDDWNNIAPRIHFAWDPFRDGKTVVRGGFGMYYDQVMLNAPLISTIFEPGRFNSQTILLPGYPDPFVGGAQQPIELPTNISVLDPNTVTPYKNVGSLGFQRELGPDLAVTLDGVYARGYHLLLLRDANAPMAPGVPRPTPGVGIAFSIETEGELKYKALQFGLQKRFRDCFSATLAYTLQSIETTTDSHREFISDSYDPSADFGPSVNDVRNTVSAAVVWTSPWGIVVGAGGQYQSPPPYNIITGDDDNGDAQINDRPPGVERNAGRGKYLWTTNLRLGYAIPIGRTRLELIAEAFNVFNHVNPTGYIGNMQSPDFGEPTQTAAGAFGPRQIQFGFRLDF